MREKSGFKFIHDLRNLAWSIILSKELVEERVESIKRGKLRGSKVFDMGVKAFKASPHVVDI